MTRAPSRMGHETRLLYLGIALATLAGVSFRLVQTPRRGGDIPKPVHKPAATTVEAKPTRATLDAALRSASEAPSPQAAL